MNPRIIKAFFAAASLMAATLLPAEAAQDPSTTPQPPPSSQTPPPEQTPPPAATAPQPPTEGQPQTTPQAPQTPEKKVVTPEEIGVSLAAPQGWNPGDAKAFNVPGDICCVWSPDNIASIAVFVQNVGKPLSPRVLLEQSAQALEQALGAQVKEKEVKDVGGMRAFSLVVTGPGNGAAIDGKGTVPTTQHWVAVPRDKDVVIFLMTTPDANYAQNEQAFQTLLGSLKVSGQQSPEQKSAA